MELEKLVLISPEYLLLIESEIRRGVGDRPVLVRIETWLGKVEFYQDMQLVNIAAAMPGSRGYLTNSGQLILRFDQFTLEVETRDDPTIIWAHPGIFTIENMIRPRCGDDLKMITVTIPPPIKAE